MKLAKLLNVDQVILDLEETTCFPAIAKILNEMVRIGKFPAAHQAAALDALKKREEQVSTGIGCGIAIPHTFSDEIDEVVLMLARSKCGIDFDALDGEPVHLLVLFISPLKDYRRHLQVLAAIAKHFTNTEIRRRLLAAQTAEEILAILDRKACHFAGKSAFAAC